MIKEIFNDPDFCYRFTSEDDLDNIEAMAAFIDDNDLGRYVEEDDGTMVELHFNREKVFIASSGGGDFFTHDIYRVNS